MTSSRIGTPSAPMDLREVVLWLHLLAIVVWVGGAFFWTIVLFTRETPPNPGDGDPWLERLGRRVYTVGWEALGLIVLTGLFNLVLRARSGGLFHPDYQRTLGIKLTLVAGMALIQLWQHFGLLPRLTVSPEHAWAKQRRSLLLTSGVVLVLAAGILWFGVQLHHL